jgi:hypothetical protein
MRVRMLGFCALTGSHFSRRRCRAGSRHSQHILHPYDTVSACTCLPRRTKRMYTTCTAKRSSRDQSTRWRRTPDEWFVLGAACRPSRSNKHLVLSIVQDYCPVSPWLGICLITKDTLSIFLLRVHHGRLHCRLASALLIQEELSLHKWPVPRVSDSAKKSPRKERYLLPAF